MHHKRRDRDSQSGQVLPIFVGAVIAMVAVAALAIDVSRVFSEIRTYRAVTDSASLAGGQDLQVAGRIPPVANQDAARLHAMQSLVQQLGATSTPTGPGCATTLNVSDCLLPGTPYRVSIQTPAPACVDCGDTRFAIKVTIDNPDFPLTFAGVFGLDKFKVTVASVAGMAYGRQYAILTLRPPKKIGSTFDVKDIRLDGGTTLNVRNGDVGSNSNIELDLSSAINLDPGYSAYIWDWPKLWVGAPPPQRLNALIRDPVYRYPLMNGARGTAPVYTDAKTSSCLALGATPACSRADLDPACLAEANKIDTTRYAFMPGLLATPAKIFCYSEGTYNNSNADQLAVGPSDLVILKPGVYYFKGGLSVNGRIVGGYEPGSPGVALMFDEAGPGNCSYCVFSGNSAETIALNVGTKFPPGATGTAATAAIDWDNKLVQTSGPSSPNPPLVITLLVRYDTNGSGGTQGCYVPTTPPLIEPAACDANKNKTLNLAGGGALAVEGVQYAPTDNVEIGGNAAGYGDVGQIIAWTLKYSGGVDMNQRYPGDLGGGILRLDVACSTPSQPCN